jgi:O-acetylhomoserine (thiol)-lyase
MAPMTAFQILQGLETLPDPDGTPHRQHREDRRLPRDAGGGGERAPPGRPHASATMRSRRGSTRAARSAILSFELKGGRDAGRKFIEKLSLFSHLANIGDAKSLVIHPATTTHFRMDDAALAAAGIGAGTVRLSIGLEHADDLIEDLGRALYASQK